MIDIHLRLDSIKRRSRYGQSMFYPLLDIHREDPFAWKADCLLPLTLEKSSFLQAIKKLVRHWEKVEVPAIVFLEQAYLTGRFNLHFLGRGKMSKAQLREKIIDSLCKNKRRQEERVEVSREVSLVFEEVEDTEDRNIYSLLNYNLKTSCSLAKKIIPLEGVNNYRNLGALPKGGFRAMRKKRSNPPPTVETFDEWFYATPLYSLDLDQYELESAVRNQLQKLLDAKLEEFSMGV